MQMKQLLLNAPMVQQRMALGVIIRTFLTCHINECMVVDIWISRQSRRWVRLRKNQSPVQKMLLTFFHLLCHCSAVNVLRPWSQRQGKRKPLAPVNLTRREDTTNWDQNKTLHFWFLTRTLLDVPFFMVTTKKVRIVEVYIVRSRTGLGCGKDRYH